MQTKLLKLLSITLFLILFSAIVEISFTSNGLLNLAKENLEKSGVDYLVTAVVLNYRSFDTMFEIFVLALAFFGTLIISKEEPKKLKEDEPILNFFSSILTPLVFMVAIFILYKGSYSAGGAFQASSLIAGGLILSFLSGRNIVIDRDKLRYKVTLSIGLIVYLSIATIGAISSTMLNFNSSGFLIMILEMSLTLTISYILFLLYLWQIKVS